MVQEAKHGKKTRPLGVGPFSRVLRAHAKPAEWNAELRAIAYVR